METLLQDLRYGVRMLLRHKGFTIVAALTLSLGIGANTAIFSVVNGVLLKPLPYPEPERLIRVFESNSTYPKFPISPLDFCDFRDQNTTFESMAGYFRQDLQLAQDDRAERLLGMRVSSGFFQTLGFRPLLGREFNRDEEVPDQSTVVILSHGLWQRRFGSDSNIVGKRIRLLGQSFTVVGVMPAGLQHVGGGWRPLPHGESVDIWWPMRLGPNRPRDVHLVNAIGRLKSGVTRKQAEAEFNIIAMRLAQQHPGAYRNWQIHAQLLHEEIVEGSQQTLLVLLGAGFFVLLIACVNVANLMLARAATREREIALRAVLGAGRARIVRQLLIESLMLAALGGLLGLLLTKLAISVLIRLGPEQLPRLDMINIDCRILVFTLLIILLTGLLFGMAPAFQSLKLNLSESLKEGGRGASSGKRQRRTRNLLVVAEVALALALLVGTGLLVRSFLKLQQTDPGFRSAGVLTMSIALYKGSEQQISLYQKLIERVSAFPGVRSAGMTSDLPWTGYDNGGFITVEGKTFPQDQPAHARYHFISADYMRTIGVPLLSGRWFNAQDTSKAREVILINQTMARKYWPGEDVIGKRITFSTNPQKDEDWMNVVGVVGDVKDYPNSTEAEPAFYWSITQQPYPEMLLTIRADKDPMGLVDAVRREVRAVDRELPISDIRTLDTVTSAAMTGQRLSLILIGFFALASLVLAAFGIYGVMSYLVSQRTHELGIRLALGAQVGDVMKLIIRQGMKLALVGVSIGIIVSLALTQLMKSMLFGVSATDPLTFALIAALLVIVALLACFIPARRATKVDPMIALRCE